MYPCEVSTSNSDTCLHGGCCSHVHIVGSGHYVDGFTGIYVCIVGSGHYADLALQAHSS